MICAPWGCSSVGRALAWHARGRQFESDQLHHLKVMAGVAQLVRASVCGTECRQFESGRPPHE